MHIARAVVDVPPVLDLVANRGKLLLNYGKGLTSLTLFESLSHAEDDFELIRQAGLDLFGNKLVGIAEQGASLGVTDDDPGDLAVAELLSADFACKSTRSNRVGVLGGDSQVGLSAGLDVVPDGDDVESRGCNDDLFYVQRK